MPAPAKTLLMLAFHFPPFAGSSGLQRTLYFVRHLANHTNWRPIILTPSAIAYPHVAARLFPPGDSQSIGLFFGLAVHDTAQVMGTAASYAEQFSDAAVVGAAAVAKLTRNVFLAGVVPLMALRHAGGAAGVSIATAVPTFVAGTRAGLRAHAR